ncbi:MAG TPA: carbohydrate kinase [Gemmatimonadaceae bacterium]|nr:carbohydrate kinase [Gemmatimonadaceae bacterium]
MYRVVGIGELLWDLLPSGARIGGAPANFAYHAGALGADARTISRVGDDALGHELLAQLRTLGVNCDCVQVDPHRPTGTVAVEIDADGQPCFDITRDVAWDCLQAEPSAMLAVKSADAVCFGTLAQRDAVARDAIRTLVAASPHEALCVLDVNLRQQYYSKALIEESLALASVLKVNDVELPKLAALFGLTGSVRAQLDQLAERWQLRAIALTRGDKGSVLRTAHEWSEHPGVHVTVVDTIGAGDAFTAAMTVGLLSGWALDDVNAHANEVAAHVASCAGGTPPLPASIRQAFVQRA